MPHILERKPAQTTNQNNNKSSNPYRMSLSIKNKHIPPLIINLMRPIFRKNQISILQRLCKKETLLIISLIIIASADINISQNIEAGGEARVGVYGLEGFPGPVLVHWVLGYAVGVVVGFEDFGAEVVDAGFDPQAGFLEVAVLGWWGLGAIDCGLYASSSFGIRSEGEADGVVSGDIFEWFWRWLTLRLASLSEHQVAMRKFEDTRRKLLGRCQSLCPHKSRDTIVSMPGNG